MQKKELLEKYHRSYTEEEFYKQNVTYAFSETQLQEAIQKLGAKDKEELTTLGYSTICLKSKVNEILLWTMEKYREKKLWLRSLTRDEQKIIIRYEMRNHECTYTGDIDDVVTLFKDVFEYDLIVSVWQEIQ